MIKERITADRYAKYFSGYIIHKPVVHVCRGTKEVYPNALFHYIQETG